MKDIFILPLLLCSAMAMSQTASDCSNAVIVCGNSIITSNASGFGTQELDTSNNPCEYEEVNSLWLELNIDETGSLEFLLTPDDPDILVDYDFYIFGPNFSCGNFDAPIRCSTTNPEQAELENNVTGLQTGSTDESEGPGPAGDSFVAPISVVAGETYYLLIDRPEGDGGFSLNWQNSPIFVDPPNIIGEPEDINTCFADFGSTVNLTINEDQISTDADVYFEYYTSRADAFDGTQQILDPTAFETDTSRTIFVKATNGNSCFEILAQQIEVPIPFSESLEFTACDAGNDGTETFPLEPIFDAVDGGLENSSSYSVSLHRTENEADTDQAGLASDYESPTGQIYARIASNEDATCYLTVPITLTVLSEDPDLPDEWTQCDTDLENSTDGITVFDLQQIFDDLVAGKANEYLLYESELERDTESEIADIANYTNTTPFVQTIYYSLISDTCESYGEIELQVESTTVELNALSPLIACDDNPQDSLLEASFDLDAFGETAYPNAEIAFFSSLEDAYSDGNLLSGTITSEDTSVFIRIETEDRCPAVEELRLAVSPSPKIDLEEEYRLCTQNPDLTIQAPEGFASYRWSRLGENTSEEIAVTDNVSITEPGTYRLTAEESYQNEGQTITCSGQTDFEVLPTDPPRITEVILGGSGINTTLEVLVTGNGDYEYSLDGETFLESNILKNVAEGTATVFVRDKTGCGQDRATVSVFGYPKFFTPNGDDVNDFWQIIGADPATSSTASISIFDRYGKFIGQFDPLGPGWDGTYNNHPLPESDYWFRAAINGQKETKGHFTLKR